jgi:hypothetical protein
VICWGAETKFTPGKESIPILAYEKIGLNGERFAMTVMGNVQLLTDQEFQAANFPPGYKPSN